MTLQEVFDAALTRFNEQGFAALDETDQLLVTIWGLEADANNGGFDQYYFNSYGDQAQIAPTALRRIGASAMAAIVEGANSKFGEAGPPGDRDARQDALFAIRDQDENAFDDLDAQFFKYPDDIAQLLVRHLKLAT